MVDRSGLLLRHGAHQCERKQLCTQFFELVNSRHSSVHGERRGPRHSFPHSIIEQMDTSIIGAHQMLCIDPAEALTQALTELLGLDELDTGDGVDVSAGTGQRVHDKRIAESGGIAAIVVIAVSTVVTAAAIVVTAPRRANSTADIAADETTTPIAQATID